MAGEKDGGEYGSPTAVQPSPRRVPPKPKAPHPDSAVTQVSAARQGEPPPYAFYIASLALVLVSLVALTPLWLFRDVFETATEVTTALSSLFALFGTVLGAYFGIKASADATSKAQGTINRANETANRVLAELPPSVGRQVLGKE